MIDNRAEIGGTPDREVVLDILAAGVTAAHPEQVLETALDTSDSILSIEDDEYDLTAFERVIIVGAGNAAGTIAATLEQQLGDWIDTGVVVTDNPTPTQRIRQVRGSHPIPDEDSVAGTEAVVELVREADESTLLLVALTGGGSALLSAPVEAISVANLQSVTVDLLESGVPIHGVNAVRKHLSQVKGGRLAEIGDPATMVGIVFSDVVGNDPSTIGSGPISPDETTFAEALTVIGDADIDAPHGVLSFLEAGAAGEVSETPTEDTGCFDAVSVTVVASGQTAIDGARRHASGTVEPLVLSASIEGDATEIGRVHAGIARQILDTGDPISPPAVVLSGGETTVHVDDPRGVGGPNQECALSAALTFAEWGLHNHSVVFACIDTDGIDGRSTGAGAIVDSETVRDPDRARRALRAHTVESYLAERDAVVETGMTGTNVNDLRVLFVGAAEQ